MLTGDDVLLGTKKGKAAVEIDGVVFTRFHFHIMRPSRDWNPHRNLAEIHITGKCPKCRSSIHIQVQGLDDGYACEWLDYQGVNHKCEACCAFARLFSPIKLAVFVEDCIPGTNRMPWEAIYGYPNLEKDPIFLHYTATKTSSKKWLGNPLLRKQEVHNV